MNEYRYVDGSTPKVLEFVFLFFGALGERGRRKFGLLLVRYILVVV